MKQEQAIGSWALVTGASSGIGLEFSRQLAARGMHIALVARRESRLREVAGELGRDHGVQTLVIAIDLSDPGASREIKTFVEAAGIRPRLLCNNAGIGLWGRFESMDARYYEKMIQLNSSTPVALSRELLSDLTSYPTSVIINVSSPGAYQPVPYMAVYAATKAFLTSFSQALHGEWMNRGVLVQTLVPGPTATDPVTTEGAYPGFLVDRLQKPEGVVRLSLGHIERGTPVVSSCGSVYGQRLLAALAPAKTVIRAVERRFRPPGVDRDLENHELR